MYLVLPSSVELLDQFLVPTKAPAARVLICSGHVCAFSSTVYLHENQYSTPDYNKSLYVGTLAKPIRYFKKNMLRLIYWNKTAYDRPQLVRRLRPEASPATTFFL